MTKKRMLVVCLSILIVALAANLSMASSQFNWKQFAGESIRVLGLKFYYTDIIAKKLPEFEALTGMKVALETYPEDQFRQKIVVEMAGGSTTVDAFTTGTSYEGRKFVVSGWYEPLEKYINDPVLTDPNWDTEDFIQSVWKAQVMDGTRVAIPLNAVTWLLIYRDDLYQKFGLSVPQTLDEFELNVKKLTYDDIYGYVGRGKRTQSVPTWSIFLHAMGGEWLDENRNPVINSTAGVESLEFYAKLMRKYANPGAAENHWYDVLSMMQQGKVAHIIDTNAWIGALSNPEKSKVADTVSYAPIPVGAGGPVAELWSWNLAISSLSHKKKPAWLFIQWVTGKDMQRHIQLQKFPSARQSAWNDPEFAKISNEAWLRSTLQSFQIARPICHPSVIEIHQIEDVVGSAIVDVILGSQAAKPALDAAAKEIKEIMAATE